jgi:translocator protein
MKFPKIKDPIKLVVAIVIANLAGIIGSVFTSSSVSTWYTTLTKPWFNPPGWIFGPVWTTLYILMGISAYLIWVEGIGKKEVKIALGVFGVQLVLNSVWSFLFFGLQSPFYSLVEIGLLWIAIVTTMYAFYKVKKEAMYLLIPYILWVSFAAILNYNIWLLNL